MNYALAILIGVILGYLNANFWSAALVFFLMSLIQHEPSRPYALVMTLIFVAYMVFAYWSSKGEQP